MPVDTNGAVIDNSPVFGLIVTHEGAGNPILSTILKEIGVEPEKKNKINQEMYYNYFLLKEIFLKYLF